MGTHLHAQNDEVENTHAHTDIYIYIYIYMLIAVVRLHQLVHVRSTVLYSIVKHLMLHHYLRLVDLSHNSLT